MQTQYALTLFNKKRPKQPFVCCLFVLFWQCRFCVCVFFVTVNDLLTICSCLHNLRHWREKIVKTITITGLLEVYNTQSPQYFFRVVSSLSVPNLNSIQALPEPRFPLKPGHQQNQDYTAQVSTTKTGLMQVCEVCVLLTSELCVKTISHFLKETAKMLSSVPDLFSRLLCS